MQATRRRNHGSERRARRAAAVWILLSMSVATMACQASSARGSRGTEEGTGLRLVHVANAGVLVTTASSSILFDALFHEPNPHYAAPTQETLRAMVAGAAPFDGIDLVLVTHMHPDHFDAGDVDRFMVKNPQAALVAPADAVEDLQASAPGWSSYEDRVISLDLRPGEKATRTVGDIRVTAVRTLHSGALQTPMNLMYLVEMDGEVVFHEGDSNASLRPFETIVEDRPPIDLALVHYWFPFARAGRSALEILQPGFIGLVHYPIQDPDISVAALRALRAPYVLLEEAGEAHSVPAREKEGG